MSCQKLIVTLCLSCTTTLFSSSALAQSSRAPTALPTPAASAPAAANKGEEQAIRWFRMLDTDKDGKISRQETAWLTRVKPSLAEEFKAADANRDGYVTQDEIRALANQRRAEREARRQREQKTQSNGTSRVSAK